MRKDKKIQKHAILPDVKYNSVWVSKLVNRVMQNGKKTVATRIVYEAIENALTDLSVTFEDFMAKIIANISPTAATTKRKLGGANYFVPVELDKERSEKFGVKFLVKAARAKTKTTRSNGKVTSLKKCKTISQALFQVLKNAFNNENNDAVSLKNEQMKIAKDNAVYAHLSSSSSRSSQRKLSMKHANHAAASKAKKHDNSIKTQDTNEEIKDKIENVFNATPEVNNE